MNKFIFTNTRLNRFKKALLKLSLNDLTYYFDTWSKCVPTQHSGERNDLLSFLQRLIFDRKVFGYNNPVAEYNLAHYKDVEDIIL